MKAVSSEFDFIEFVDKRWSVGSHSREWMEETFRPDFADELRGTIYVTGNHYADRVDPESIKKVDRVRRYEYGEFPLPPAHVVTDRAISLGRKHDFDRFIVHYMQPHKPFLNRLDLRNDIEIVEGSKGVELYHRYLNGEILKEDLVNGFIDNLRYVLCEVKILLNNINAKKVAITSDHGQALGERFLYDHRYGISHPSVRQVPWVETEANDRNTHSPDHYELDSTDSNVTEQLKQLGYR
jgi:hypothetical protein